MPDDLGEKLLFASFERLFTACCFDVTAPDIRPTCIALHTRPPRLASSDRLVAFLGER
jgi:hypothetical protein